MHFMLTCIELKERRNGVTFPLFHTENRQTLMIFLNRRKTITFRRYASFRRLGSSNEEIEIFSTIFRADTRQKSAADICTCVVPCYTTSVVN